MVIRKAREQDARAIRNLIHRVGINPMSLDWRRFVVAVDARGHVIGCGQIKPHGVHIRELASIAVQPEQQDQGIGTDIIQNLLAENSLPLYLTCRASMEPYYQRFGFRSIRRDAMPAYYRRIDRFVRWIRKLNPKMEELLVMVKTA